MKRKDAKQRIKEWEELKANGQIEYYWQNIYCESGEPLQISYGSGVRGMIGGLICNIGLKLIGKRSYYVRFIGSRIVDEQAKTPDP